MRFLYHTQRRATFGSTPLDEWSACRRDLYLTTHNTHNRQTFMLPVGFEPMISAGERPQTYALDRTATGTGRAPLCSITDTSYHNWVCAYTNDLPSWFKTRTWAYQSLVLKKHVTFIFLEMGRTLAGWLSCFWTQKGGGVRSLSRICIIPWHTDAILENCYQKL